MKSEVAFFRDKRGRMSAANLLKFYRDLGYTDEQILVEMKKILASRNQSTHSPTEQNERSTINCDNV